jgi:hypothetical protein
MCREENENVTKNTSVTIAQKNVAQKNFLTFSTCEPPENVRICYELLEVRKFTPNPFRCWNCLKFNHSKNSCTASKRCANCGKDFHLTDESEICVESKECVNCNGPHSSLDRKCPIYLMNKEINSIMVNCNLSRKEAWILYKSRNPITPYSRVLSQNSSASTSTAIQTQKPCKCEAQEKLIMQMQQQIKELQQQILSYQHSLQTPSTSIQQTPQSHVQNVVPIQIPINDLLQNSKDIENRVSRLDQEKQSQTKDRSRSNSRNNMPPPSLKKPKEEKARKDKDKDKNNVIK